MKKGEEILADFGGHKYALKSPAVADAMQMDLHKLLDLMEKINFLNRFMLNDVAFKRMEIEARQNQIEKEMKDADPIKGIKAKSKN